MDNRPGRRRDELEVLQQDMTAFFKRGIVLWAVRWTIGFAIIGVVVSFNPQWRWLWWVGIGFAALTPFMTLVSREILRRQVRRTEKALADLESAMHGNRPEA